MKKFRRILSFIVAMAMIMSMSTLCFLVTAEGSGSTTVLTDTEWSLGANAFEIGEAGTDALLEKGPFKLDLVGKQLSATVVNVNGVASIQSTDGVTGFAKSASGIIDLAPAAGDSRVIFVAPVAGTYAFSASLEKTSMPTYATGSIVKNWSQIGATETAGGGFKGGWGYAGKGITNDSGWASGVNAVLSQSSVVELAAGQCITVSVDKQGDCDNTHTTLKMFNVYKIEDIKDGSAWSLGDEFKIGAENSTALLSNGLFGLDLKGKNLSSTVVKNGGVESIVSTDGKRAFTKSATGIVDITPAAGTCAQVYFKAPADGTYWFAVAAEKTDMSGLPEGKLVKNWTEIGPKASLAGGYTGYPGLAAGVNYTGAAIGNTTGFTLKDVSFSGAIKLTAGHVITISINTEGDTDETQTTLKMFNVVKLPDGATSEAFASTIGTPDAIGTVTKNNFTLGSITPHGTTLEGTSLRPVIATELVPAWNGAPDAYKAWAVLHNETKYPVFGTTQTGSAMDMMPKYALPSVITYTAPSDGVYLYDAIFKRSSGTPEKSIAMIVGTGNASGAYVGELEKTEIAANQTLLVNGTVELKAGDTIWFVADNYEAAVSAEVGVKKINVTRVGDYVPAEEHVCSEWEGANCNTKGVCVECGEATGTTDASVHATPDQFTYVNNGDDHTKHYACCNAVAAEHEAHDFTSGNTCVCTAEKPAPAKYTAALTTTTASVRKNQIAYVTVDISGENAKYAAGEIVVTFDDSVFDFNADKSTLPANTKVKATTGKIVLVITGADKEFGADGATVTLAFDAVAKSEASNITLDSAAFSLRADAKSEDLTAANITAANVAVEVTAQAFKVTVGEHLKADAEEVIEGNNFEFTYSAADGAYYDYGITVMSGDTDISEQVTFADGKWIVPAEYITGDLTITTTEPTAKEFGVTITPDGYATGNENAYYKTDYTFVIKADDGDASSTVKYNTYVLGSITINGVTYGGEGNPAIADVATTTDRKTYVIRGTAITGAITITIATVEQDPGSVDVTVNAPTDVTVDYEDKATLGQTYSFTVDFSQADTLYSYKVLYNGTEIEASEGVYTTSVINAGPVVITVEKTLITNVIVKDEKEYLDLGTTKMWLVLNDMNKLDGKVYTINGEEMFWSDRYEAYCYLVIAESAPDAESFTIDIISGDATDIDYGMNVNKSAELDANDAQLVYDMYSDKLYQSFDAENGGLAMEKFLRADVGVADDFLIDSGDATAIINAVLANRTASN